nr:hypothetical protein Iba_chr12cCG16510 [Ipomoea batatas]
MIRLTIGDQDNLPVVEVETEVGRHIPEASSDVILSDQRWNGTLLLPDLRTEAFRAALLFFIIIISYWNSGRERHRAMTLVLDKVVEDVASKAVNKISPPTSMLRMRLPNTRSEEEA